jgi:lipopolysaccharide biosynthesis regulator YciM
LINLGRAYARMGRLAEASAMFSIVMQSRDSVDLVLADGRVMSSKDAARKAYAGLQTRVATR